MKLQDVQNHLQNNATTLWGIFWNVYTYYEIVDYG